MKNNKHPNSHIWTLRSRLSKKVPFVEFMVSVRFMDNFEWCYVL